MRIVFDIVLFYSPQQQPKKAIYRFIHKIKSEREPYDIFSEFICDEKIRFFWLFRN